MFAEFAASDRALALLAFRSHARGRCSLRWRSWPCGLVRGRRLHRRPLANTAGDLAALKWVGLTLISFFIFYEAYLRLSAPPAIRSVPMTIVATGGLLINLICAGLLHSDRQDDLNMRGAWLHIIGDALGSLGAIIAGVLIAVLGWNAADPIISIVIGVSIVWSSWHLMRDATNVLLERTPAQFGGSGRCHSRTEGV